MLDLTGRMSVDYFQVRCAKCMQEVEMTYLGKDPALPRFKAECKTCHGTQIFKANWDGLPPKPWTGGPT